MVLESEEAATLVLRDCVVENLLPTRNNRREQAMVQLKSTMLSTEIHREQRRVPTHVC